MRASWPGILRFLRDGAEPLAVLAAIAGLRQFGLAGRAPLWIIAVVLLSSAVFQQDAFQRRLSGSGDGSRRTGLRVAGHIIATSATMYLTGWGALLAVAHLHVLSVHLRQSGSRAWRPAALASAASIGAGQFAFGTGLLFSHLPVMQTHGIALLVTLGTVTTARALGLAVEQREDAETALRRSEERFRALVHDGTDVILEKNADGIVTYASPATLAVMGYPPEDLVGRPMETLAHPDDYTAAVELRARVLAGDDSVAQTEELRFRHADGTWHWHELSLRNMLDHPDVHALIGHHRDITERRAAQDRIAHAATHDSLTGLANSPTLYRDLERAIAQGTRYQHTAGLLFLDLDGFKQVNDTYGHAIGDRLLTTISEILRSTVRGTDTVGRLGGDEFGVVLTRVGGAEEALAVAARIIRGVEGHASVAGLRLDVGCSIGVALAYPGGTDAKTLMRHADAAMYRTKRRGRNGAELYVEQDVVAPWLS